VDSDLERLVAEDEVARTAVASAKAAALRDLDALREQLARERQARLLAKAAEVDAAVDAILVNARKDAAARRDRRAAYERERAAAADAALTDAVAACVAVLRGDGEPP